MARLFTSGFEIDSTSNAVEWSSVSTNLTRTSTTVRSGAFAVQVSASSTDRRGILQRFVTSGNGPYYARFYLRRQTSPGSANAIACFTNATVHGSVSSSDPHIKITTGGALALFNGATQIGSNSAALTANTWYRVEIAFDNSPSSGSKVLRAYLDGVEFAGSATLSALNGSIQSFAVGGQLFAESVTGGVWQIDDIAINDNTGSHQNGLPGAGNVVTVFPDGAGDSNQWSNTSNGAGSSTNYQLVDENPPNDATDFVQTGVANRVDLYAIGDPGVGAGDTVNCVQVVARHANNNNSDPTAAYALVAVKTSGGTQSQGSSVVPNTTFWRTGRADSTNFSLCGASLTMHVDPDGAAWTSTTLGSMQAGPKLVTAGANRIQVTSVWVTVDYTPAAGGGSEVEGGATASLGGLTATVVGRPTVPGAAAASLGGVTATVAAVRRVKGAAAASLGGVTATVVGVQDLTHSFEGWADGANVAANSGSGSGDQFTLESDTAGGSCTASDDWAAAGTMSMAFALGGTAGPQRRGWAVNANNTTDPQYVRLYLRPDQFTGTVAVARGMDSGSSNQRWRLQLVASTRVLTFRDQGNTAIWTSAALTATSTYRVEILVGGSTSATGRVKVFAGHSTTEDQDSGDLATQNFGGPIREVWFGQAASGSSLSGKVDEVGWSPSSWLGPAVTAATVNGVAAAPLGGLTAAASGRPYVTGTATASLGGLTASAAGNRLTRGTATGSLGALTAAAAGDRIVDGAAAANLGGLTAAASGISLGEVAGTATATLGALTVTASGDRTVKGSAAATFGGLTAAAAGDRRTYGAATAGLGGLTAAAFGTASGEVAGAATANLGGLTAAVAGDRRVKATASAPLGAVTATVAGDRRVNAAAAATLGGVTATAAARRRVRGVTAATLGGLTAVCTGQRRVKGQATVMFGGAATAAGRRTTRGTAAANLGGLTCTVHGEVHGPYLPAVGRPTVRARHTSTVTTRARVRSEVTLR